MKWKDVSLSKKLFLGFGVILILLSVISLLSIISMRSADDSTQDIIMSNNVMANLKQKEVDHLDWVSAVKEALLMRSAERLTVETDPHKCGFGKWFYGEGRREAENRFSKLAGSLRDVEEPHKRLHQSVIEIKKDLESKNTVDFHKALTVFQGETMKALKEVRGNIQEMNAVIAGDVKNQEASIRTMIARNTTLIVIISLLAFAMGILLTLLIVRNITRDLTKAVEAANAISDGDLTVRIGNCGKDEIGQLLQAMKAMIASLSDVVGNVIVSSQNLSQAVSEIASGNENLSQRTSEQASSLEEIASTIEEAVSTINQNAENASLVSRFSGEAVGLAERGGLIVQDSVKAINGINEYSNRIGEIISMINEIAFQTNLLALNAAVEAARAGEQGRGFAVVAGEVRNLAQRSGSAAKEIGDLIKTSLDQIGSGTELVNKSGKALSEIIESVRRMEQLMSEIAAASVEKKQGIEQINTSIMEIDSMTQQNSALVEETAAAGEEMSNQARELLALVERFRISDGSAARS